MTTWTVDGFSLKWNERGVILSHAHALSLSSLSTEYIRIEVSATESGAAVDPTGDTVEFAFMTNAEDEPSSWDTGEWETDPAGPTYYARILVGPSGKVLSDDRY